MAEEPKLSRSQLAVVAQVVIRSKKLEVLLTAVYFRPLNFQSFEVKDNKMWHVEKIFRTVSLLLVNKSIFF